MTEVRIEAEGLGKRHRLGSMMTWGRWAQMLTGKRFERESFWALRDVTFDVRAGEVMGIVGHNGAGKSTLLKLLSGVSRPTEGRAIVRGKVASLLEVGAGFHPELTARENIFLAAAILGRKAWETSRRLDDIVQWADAERMLDTPAKRLSTGMRSRLAFSVACHLAPEIVVVDEVLAVGDQAFQRRCCQEMRRMVDEGRAVLFVSHNLGIVESLCDRAMWLERGELVRIGGCAEVVGEYRAAQRQSAAVRDLSTAQRGGEPGVETLRLLRRGEVCDADGSTVHELPWGEPAMVRLTVGRDEDAPNEPLHELTVVVSIDTADQQRVVTVASPPDQVLAVGVGRSAIASVKLDAMRLAPGAYTVAAAVYRGHEKLDEVPIAAEFEVIGAGAADARVTGMGEAKLAIDADWSFESQADTQASSPAARRAA
ncbi:MAG: ABC transporter ATP-binding protein [Planctomycetota bacterium]